MMIGGYERPVRVVVQENMSAKLNPRGVELTDARPGMTYTQNVQLVNEGNIPFDISDPEISPTLNAHALIKNFTNITKEKSTEGFDSWINKVLKGVGQDLSAVKINVKESGQTLQPGESVLLHITFSLANNIDLKQPFKGSISFHDKTLSFSIIPPSETPTQVLKSVKPSPSEKKPAAPKSSKTNK
jgi:hypothetical protein